MLLPVVLGTPLLYAPSVFKPLSTSAFPSLPRPALPPLRTGVVYISGCSEGKTNGILHKYPPPTLVFRNYQTTLPSSHSLTLRPRPPSRFNSRDLPTEDVLLCERFISHRKVDGDRQMGRGGAEQRGEKSSVCKWATTFEEVFRGSFLNFGAVEAFDSDYPD